MNWWALMGGLGCAGVVGLVWIESRGVVPETPAAFNAVALIFASGFAAIFLFVIAFYGLPKPAT